MRALVRRGSAPLETELPEIIAIPILKTDARIALATGTFDHRIATGFAVAAPGVFATARVELADLSEGALVVSGAATGATTTVGALVRRGQAVGVDLAAGDALMRAEITVGFALGTLCARCAAAWDAASTIRLANCRGRAWDPFTARRNAPRPTTELSIRTFGIPAATFLTASRLTADAAPRTAGILVAGAPRRALADVGDAGHASIAERATGIARSEGVAVGLTGTPTKASWQTGRAERNAQVGWPLACLGIGATASARRNSGFARARAIVAVVGNRALQVRSALRPVQRFAHPVAVADGIGLAARTGRVAARQRFAVAGVGTTPSAVPALEVVSA